jgi:hypothetical protein
VAAVAVTAVDTFAPLFRSAPEWADTDGDLAAQLASDLGWSLDGVQRWTVDACLAVDDVGLPGCGSVCIVGPRQTVGKTVSYQVAALFDVFVAGVPLHVWTAHRYSTAEKTYRDMQARIQSNRGYARRCSFVERTGQQAIVVDDGASVIEFHARSGKGGRGFPGVSRLTLDEWLFGRPGDIGALAPTLVTMDDAQIRYASSAGLPESAELRRLRKRGRAGDDPSLAYQELGAVRTPCGADDGSVPPSFGLSRCRHDLDDDTCALNSRDLWWQANSGLWCGRVREANVARQRAELPATEFAREFLSWWEDPPGGDGGALDPQKFAALADPDASRGRPMWFGVAVAPDRSWSALVAAWARGGGIVHCTVVDYRPHTTWLRDRVAEVRRAWGGTVIVDTRARDLIPDVREPSESDQALAEAVLSDRITAGTLRHGNQPELLTAVSAAMWRTSGAHRRLEPSGTLDISPIRAAALAVHAASTVTDPLSQVW